MASNAVPAGQPLAVMVGLPDDSLVRLMSDGQRLDWSVPGNTSFPSLLLPEFRARLVQVFFGPSIRVTPSPQAYGRPVVNNVGDPDTSSVSLRILVELLEITHARCFNHPLSVLDSGRDRIAAKLAHIPGMQVPRTLRLRIDEPEDLVQQAQNAGLAFPLIVRVAGSHGGNTTVKVDQPDQMKIALRQIAWGGRDLYVTEYVEYRDEDGRYRKMRLVTVGGEYFFRHLIVADHWHIHAQDRDSEAAAEETAMLSEFTATMLPRIEDTLDAVREAMGLDFFGMDCSLRPDGRLLLFEANTVMDILTNSIAPPNCWDAPIERIRDALTALLFDPGRWHDRTGRRDESVPVDGSR